MKKLFETKEREKAHRELARVLKSGEYPLAECREYRNDPNPYQVWSESSPIPSSPAPEPQPKAEAAAHVFTPEDLDILAELVVRKLTKKAGA